MHQLLIECSNLFLSEVFLIECIPYYFCKQMIFYVLFVHKKSVSKKSLYSFQFFIKNYKFEKTKKKTFLVGSLGGFFVLFWVGFF
jgi:hypothetical protein